MTRHPKTLLLTSLLVAVSILLPVGVFVADWQVKHQDVPQVEDCAIDLSTLDDYSACIPLAGEWEFFWDKWIVTDGLQDAQPDAVVDIPSSWEGMVVDGQTLSRAGVASYRLHVKNCPEDLSFFVRVPDFRTQYRVFIDGTPTLQGDVLDRDFSKLELRSENKLVWTDYVVPGDCDIVIEVATRTTGGLYMAPQLEENRNATVRPTHVAFVQALLLGALCIFIVAFTLMSIYGAQTFNARCLLLLVVVLTVRVFSRTEMFRLKVFKIIGMHVELVWLLQMLSAALLPLCILMCLKHLYGHALPRTFEQLVKGFAFGGCVLSALFAWGMDPRFAWALVALSCALCVTMLLYCLSRSLRREQSRDVFLFIGATCSLPSALFVDAVYESGFLAVNATLVFGICAVLYSVLVLALYIRRMVHQERKALELERVRYELRDAQISLMMSQIRPHFLYNSLTAIMALIPLDQEASVEALRKFVQYLRVNIDAIKGERTIPIERELNHVQTYLYIEKMRFAERLEYSLDVRETGFSVPQLSIQPLVENAVKHGICKKAEGGRIRIGTYRQGDANVVEIADDGVGFVLDALDDDDGGGHAGIKNVEFRLAELGGTLSFETTPGHGCKAIVRLPRESGTDKGEDQ